MTAEHLKQITLEYRSRLIYFANKIVQDDYWAQNFADDALNKVFKENPDDIKKFMYSNVADACIKYLKAHGKTLSMEQVTYFAYEAEMLNELLHK